jgi:hypothetical protein
MPRERIKQEHPSQMRLEGVSSSASSEQHGHRRGGLMQHVNPETAPGGIRSEAGEESRARTNEAPSKPAAARNRQRSAAARNRQRSAAVRQQRLAASDNRESLVESNGQQLTGSPDRREDSTKAQSAPGAISSEDDWSSSPERAINLRNRMIAFAVFIICAGVSYALWFVHYETGWSIETTLLIITPIAIIAVLAYLYGTASIVTARARFRARQQGEAHAKLEKSFDRLQGDLKLDNLIRLNREQMDAYHLLTKGQAADSYKYSQFASAAGLLILLIGASIAILSKDTTTKLMAGALGSLGTVLSSYIARTHMRMYDRSLRQLNFYFEQPLIYSYLLTAERLAQDLPDEAGLEVRKSIAHRVLTCAFDRIAFDPVTAPVAKPRISSGRSSSSNKGRRSANSSKA